MNQKEIIENIAFSVGPLLALFSARFGLKAWLHFEIAAAIILGGVLLISPNYLLTFSFIVVHLLKIIICFCALYMPAI